MKTSNNENAGKTFYVATVGNDSRSDNLPTPNRDMTDGQFSTLERARDAVVNACRGRQPSGHITVMLRSGKYFLAETIELGPTAGDHDDCARKQAQHYFTNQFLHPTRNA